MKSKRGSILIENVIFIVLNVVFLAILAGFIYKQGSGLIVLEQAYAKNIALLIDSAKPITEMNLKMDDAFKLAQKNGINREQIVTINGNVVTVKLSSDSGYKYSFFNNVDVTTYPDIFPKNNYLIKINGYNP